MKIFHSCLVGLGVLAALSGPGVVSAQEGATSPAIEAGKKIAYDRGKGNCLACHYIDGGESPGNIGPPLIAMAVRFPDKEKLRAQIWDATVVNPASAMPPFGSHRILSETEIDQVVEFIWTR